MSVRLKTIPLTSKDFAPYGDVIEAGIDSPNFPINDGRAQRHDSLGFVDALGPEGKPTLSALFSQPTKLPASLHIMERHPLGSQAFIPMDGGRMIIVVAPKTWNGDVRHLQAFISNGLQGINYHLGVWHHPLIVLKATHLAIVDRTGGGNNCDLKGMDGVMIYI